MKTGTNQRKRGFVLMEVVLAIGVFAIAATGFVVALHRLDKLAALTQQRMRITRILDSALKEAISLPAMQEGKTTVNLDELGVEVETAIKPIEDMQNKDGQLLQQMFMIKVTAFWVENNQWQQESAETWRYVPLYHP